MLALAKRGHHVTVVSPFKIKEPITNYTHIDLSNEFPSLVGTFDFDYASEYFMMKSTFARVRVMAEFVGPDFCRQIFSLPKLQDIYAGKHQYDVIFTEIFGTDCWLAIGHKLKVGKYCSQAFLLHSIFFFLSPSFV